MFVKGKRMFILKFVFFKTDCKKDFNITNLVNVQICALYDLPFRSHPDKQHRPGIPPLTHSFTGHHSLTHTRAHTHTMALAHPHSTLRATRWLFTALDRRHRRAKGWSPRFRACRLVIGLVFWPLHSPQASLLAYHVLLWSGLRLWTRLWIGIFEMTWPSFEKVLWKTLNLKGRWLDLEVALLQWLGLEGKHEEDRWSKRILGEGLSF